MRRLLIFESVIIKTDQSVVYNIKPGKVNDNFEPS